MSEREVNAATEFLSGGQLSGSRKKEVIIRDSKEKKHSSDPTGQECLTECDLAGIFYKIIGGESRDHFIKLGVEEVKSRSYAPENNSGYGSIYDSPVCESLYYIGRWGLKHNRPDMNEIASKMINEILEKSGKNLMKI